MSFSDLSDLTDLSSSEEDIPLAQTTQRQMNKQRENITPSLRPPRTVQYSAQSIYCQMQDDAVDLNPEYQRDVVWTDDKQKNLIDSLFHNYYIPPIIFSVTRSPDGSEMRTCIDGKQRLTSIQRFMDGLIEHRDSQRYSVTSKKTWYTGQSGRSKTILTPKMKRIFDNKQIVCMEYDDLTNEQEREIFQRVQNGVALTPAERLQAIGGERTDFVLEIKAAVLGEKGFSPHFNWDSTRARDFQGIISVMYMAHKDGAVKGFEPIVTRLISWAQEKTPLTSQFKDSMRKTFDIFVRLVTEPRYNKPINQKRVAPIEFYMIGYLIYKHSAKLTLQQLSVTIEHMRKDVRGKWDDIRHNTKIFRDMMDFINKGVSKLGFDNNSEATIHTTVDLVPSKPVATPSHAAQMRLLPNASATAPRRIVKTKRKRLSQDSDDESYTGSTTKMVKAPPARKRNIATKAVSASDTKASTSVTKARAKVKETSAIVSHTTKRSKAPHAQGPSMTPTVVAKVESPSAEPASVLVQADTRTQPTPKPFPASPNLGPIVADPSKPTKAVTLKLSASTPPAPAPGPQSAPPIGQRPVRLPQPSNSRPPSAPPIETLTPQLPGLTLPTGFIGVKNEPRHSPALPSPVSTVNPGLVDRLAAMRAAKAATGMGKVEAATPKQSPSLGSIPSQVTHDPRRSPSLNLPPSISRDPRRKQSLQTVTSPSAPPVGVPVAASPTMLSTMPPAPQPININPAYLPMCPQTPDGVSCITPDSTDFQTRLRGILDNHFPNLPCQAKDTAEEATQAQNDVRDMSISPKLSTAYASASNLASVLPVGPKSLPPTPRLSYHVPVSLSGQDTLPSITTEQSGLPPITIGGPPVHHSSTLSTNPTLDCGPPPPSTSSTFSEPPPSASTTSSFAGSSRPIRRESEPSSALGRNRRDRSCSPYDRGGRVRERSWERDCRRSRSPYYRYRDGGRGRYQSRSTSRGRSRSGSRSRDQDYDRDRGRGYRRERCRPVDGWYRKD